MESNVRPHSATGELVGGRAAREARPQPGDDDEAAEVAAELLPYTYYMSGMARARLELFQRRGRLTRELGALGLPVVYENPKGVLVGKQVSTEDNAAQQQQQPQPAWRRLRQQALNPAHNPVMARNIRLKAQLAKYAARGAEARQAQPSARVVRYNAAMNEPERTIAKLHIITGAERRRIGSAPVSKPYYPRLRRGGVPANETEGGDLMPGRIAKLMAQQVAEEEEEEARVRAEEAPLSRAAQRERRRQQQIQALADVIVAAPQLGIHELGSYLPHELGADPLNASRPAPPWAPSQAPRATPSYGSGPLPGPSPGPRPESLVVQSSAQVPFFHSLGSAGPAPATGSSHGRPPGAAAAAALPAEYKAAAELAEAVRLLELSAAAGRAAVAAAEDDYGARLVGRSGDGEGGDGDGDVSPAASSYGSGGHYLYEEGMAEDDGEGDGGGSGRGSDEDGGGEGDGGREGTAWGTAAGGGDAGGEQPQPAGVRYPDQVVAQVSPQAGLEVVLYPAVSAVRRRRQMARDLDGGRQAAWERLQQVRDAEAAAARPYDIDAMRRWDAQLANEAVGGRQRQQRRSLQRADAANADPIPAPPENAPFAPPADREPGPGGNRAEVAEAADAATDTAETTAPAVQQPTTTTTTAAAAPAAPPLRASPPPSSAALLRLPNEVTHIGRARILEQPEAAGMDTSGRWTEGVVAARRPPAAGGEKARRRQADLPPPWQRGSHAERAEAALAAASQAAEAAAVAAAAAAHEGGGPPVRIVARAVGQQVPAALPRPPAAPAVEGADAERLAGARRGGRGVQPVPPTVAVAVAVAVASNTTPRLESPAVASTATQPHGPRAAEGGRARGGRAVGSAAEGGAADAAEGGAADAAEGGAADAAEGADDGDGPFLERFGMLSDDDADADGGGDGRGGGWGAAGGRIARNAWEDSSSDDDDPWGVEGADALGYPLSFGRDHVAPPAPVVPDPNPDLLPGARGGGAHDDDEASSVGSWGIDRRPVGLQVPSDDNTEPSGQAGDFLHRASVGQGPTIGLLEDFGLVEERIVHPADIPPLTLTPPPDWLLGAYSAQGAHGAQDEVTAAKRPQGEAGGTQPTVEQKRRPVGRVEAALEQAKARRPVRYVQHDDKTFYFSQPR